MKQETCITWSEWKAIRSLPNVYDKDDAPLVVTLSQFSGDRSLGIQITGYGEYSAMLGGYPVVLENRNGIPYLVVWADINQEDPTHVISLAGAAEKERK